MLSQKTEKLRKQIKRQKKNMNIVKGRINTRILSPNFLWFQQKEIEFLRQPDDQLQTQLYC